LVRRGHEVQVVTRSISGRPRDDEIDGVKIRRWIEPISIGPLFGLTFVAGVVRALRRLRPTYDLIHTHQGLWESISCGVARGLLSEAPTIIQPASSGYYGEAEEMARTKGFPLLRRFALRNTAYVAISEDIERQWLALGVPTRKMIRLASGVDTKRFRPGPSALEAEMPAGPRVMFTGRIHPQKNLDLLIDIWPEVAAATHASLVLVGQGPERERLAAKAESLGVGRFIHFAGATEDPSDHLRAADVFALPSVAEGMSNSLLEAMATGLPCLASEIGGNVDLLGDGVGRLIPANDRRAWTTTLIDIISRPESSRLMGEVARARIEREFSIRAVVDRYVSLYKEVLRGDFPHPA